MLAFLCCYPSSEKQLFVSDGTELEPEPGYRFQNRNCFFAFFISSSLLPLKSQCF